VQQIKWASFFRTLFSRVSCFVQDKKYDGLFVILNPVLLRDRIGLTILMYRMRRLE